ncbi:HD domain-containing protein [Patescibacteria group bacterium]|nr:HD domain-containing protein [Patescibacteria group bacterium]
MLLSREGVYRLHQKYCQGVWRREVLDIVWTHSLIVEEMALRLADNLRQNFGVEVDRKLVKTGAWVHDVGFYCCFDENFQKTKKYIFHGLEGYNLLIKEGVEERVARFALVHTGVGVNQERAAEAGLPADRSYVPVALEEEMVTFADCFHSKGPVRFSRFEEIAAHIKEKRPEDLGVLVRFKEKYGLPDVESLEKKYGQWQLKMNEWAKATNNE